MKRNCAKELAAWVAPAVLLFAADAAVARDGLAPPTAIDTNPDPDIVEVHLTASEELVRLGTGKAIPMYTYNGITPGPTIEGDIGNRLIVHFTNLLDEETTIHWHGVEVPANMDGSDIAQLAVQPGETFRYEFDLLRAATYWYHPHIRTNEQVEKGLYGALVVRDAAEDSSFGLPEQEHVLLLDDILLDVNGEVAEPLPSDPLDRSVTLLNGREGNRLLVNGEFTPKVKIDRDRPQRLRLVNVANTRFMRLSIPGHTMYRVGGDAGLIDEPIEIQPIGLVPDPDDPGRMISDPDPAKGLLLTPGERADVVFTPNRNGRIHLEWHDIARGRHSTAFGEDGAILVGDDEEDGKAPAQRLLTLKPVGPRHRHGFAPPPWLRDVDEIDVTGAEKIVLELGHTPPDANGDVVFFLQRKENVGQCPLPPGTPCPLPFPAVTPADASVVSVGETRIVEVNNLTGGDHNFHLHGFFFQHIETQFVDMDNPENNVVIPAKRVEWKDSIALPKRPGAPMRSRTITRLAVVFDDTGREGLVTASGKVPTATESGGWVMHCHILEHADGGMMSFVQVVD